MIAQVQISPFLAGFILAVLVIIGNVLWLSLALIFQSRVTPEARGQSIFVKALTFFGIIVSVSIIYIFYLYFTGQQSIGEFSSRFLRALPMLIFWNLTLPMCRLVFEALVVASVKRWQAIGLSGLILVSMTSLALYWILFL